MRVHGSINILLSSDCHKVQKTLQGLGIILSVWVKMKLIHNGDVVVWWITFHTFKGSLSLW